MNMTSKETVKPTNGQTLKVVYNSDLLFASLCATAWLDDHTGNLPGQEGHLSTSLDTAARPSRQELASPLPRVTNPQRTFRFHAAEPANKVDCNRP